MDCGIPFCHTGTLLNGMASGWPDSQPDPGVERFGLPAACGKEALERLHKTNNFPEFTGRVACAVPKLSVLGNQRASGDHQEILSAPSLTAVGRRAGSSRTAGSPDR